MLSITVYPEGPSCLPSQTMGEETTSDSSNSEESSLYLTQKGQNAGNKVSLNLVQEL